MRKHLLLICLSVSFMFMSFAASSQEWQKLETGKASTETYVNLLSSSGTTIEVAFDFNGYALQSVITSKGDASKILIPGCARMQEKGAPELPLISRSVVIPDDASMTLSVEKSEYIELDNLNIAPSKGVITRDKDPALIPYIYGEVYEKDAFYPGVVAKGNAPYNIRNVRGESITIYPVQYNPVTKKVRIYTKVVVKLEKSTQKAANAVAPNPQVKNDEVFENVLSNHFLNYDASREKLSVSKNMLIVCYSSYMSAMQEFKSWKESIGYTVNLVDYSTIGSASALKSYVQNQYNQNGIGYLLLVGDHAQVPASSTSAGYSDNNYGYTSGNDHYLDLFVGRFSAESSTQLQTQIDRSIYYERDINSSATWFKTGVGIASNEGTGGGGDDGESDEQHMNNIEYDLEGYGYSIDRVYQDGGSASQLTSILNSGSGIINYVGHGSNTTWASMYYSQSNVNSLTNENKLPFVISVACVVGNFTGQTCFAETWLRATNNGNPTGAIVFCGSTINQSWKSPMCAQDKMNDLLVANSYVTYGGMFVNGMFQMIDEYGSDGENMADTWTVFGDPSVQMRTPGNPQGPDASTENPPVADFSASATTITEGQTVTFTSTSSNNPTSLSWSFDGGSPSTSTEASPVVTYNTAGTYQVSLTATNAYGQDTETKTNYITVEVFVPEYCASKGDNSSYEWIEEVTLGTYTKTSGAAGYTDFTTETIEMAPGSDVNVSLTPGFASTTYNEYWKIWIDYNNDYEFTADELAFDAGSLSKTTVTGTISVPASATGTTRMRVSMKYNGSQTACETFGYGEVEDYTVSFSSGGGDTQAPTTPTNLAASEVQQNTLALSWTASTDNVGVTAYDVYMNGTLYSTETTTTANITGLTAETTYSFYVKAKDAAGNVSSASNALSITTLPDGGAVEYCASQGNNTSYEWIELVQLNEIDNTSGSNNGYADYTNLVATVAPGASQTIYFQATFASSSYTEYWHVWIDWDQNGTFESDERMVYGSSSSSNKLSGTFTVPTDAVLGNTRMRITMKYNAEATACETFSYGEVEDYTINVSSRQSYAKVRNQADELGFETAADVELSPVPAENDLTVCMSNGAVIGKVTIYNILGVQQRQVLVDDVSKQIDISSLPSGTYLIAVENEREKVVKRFIKQ